jgi:hypothetical protein
MTVHANSVIPTWINSWQPTFYASLTDKENSAYLQSTGLTYWQPYFTTLSNNITAYRDFNRGSELVDFIPIYYGYMILGTLYGSSMSALTDATYLYNINGFIAATISRPVNYYDDLTVDTHISAKMVADIAAVAAANSVETSLVTSVKNTCTGSVKGVSYTALFQDLAVVTPIDKAGMAQLIFITKKFKEIFQHLNVGSLALPPGV